MPDPGNIPLGESGRCWAGGVYSDMRLTPNSNQFYAVSLFTPDETGKSRRRKANFSTCHVIGLDDVREKLPIEQVERLPPPSIVIKSSLHSEQWLYLLETPCSDIGRIDNLHDGLINNGLAPNSKDPGQKGVTRYLRLPEGCNTKAKRINENNGTAPRCQITEWHPEYHYTLEQLAEPFGVDLHAPRSDKRVDGATTISDHPLLHTDAVYIKEVRSDGRFDITCPWVDEHTGKDDSGTAIFTNSDGSIGFKCHHGNCESRTGTDLLKAIEAGDPGFNERLKSWQMFREFPAAPLSLPTSVASPLALLLTSCANGESLKMKKQMLADKFILKDIAILGHWTVFYGAPGTGKTLLTLWMVIEAVKTGTLSGEDVFYANCDDNYKGGVNKLEIAEKYGFKMLIPNVKGFKTSTLPSIMMGLAETGEANGKIVILDTLKKFTDLMDKKMSSEFGKVARAFVSAGGSLICLAHVNKHKGLDGKSISAGTSDIKDDADCCYTIEHINKSKTFCSTTHTVRFENSKSRGNVLDEVSFQYTKQSGEGYIEMLDSVNRVSKDVVESVQKSAMQGEQHEKDAEVIEQVRCAITNGQYSNGNIVKFVVGSYKTPRSRVRDVLDRYEGRLWRVEKGLHNKSIYSLNTAPIVPVEAPVPDFL